MTTTLILLALSFYQWPALPAPHAQVGEKNSGTIILTVVGLNNSNSDVKVGLYNSAQSFSGKTKEMYSGTGIKVFDKRAQCVFSNIPYGEYAIKLFHDEDGDDQIDTNFLGIPTEQYGFSNNANGLFGPSSFDRAKFSVSSDTVRVEISLN